ncbi:5974_t:CDS:2 [Funneliformis geosporum]|uniref:5974_t:CDS:1 n=1 Tax=Funneliformis geosporum TaxID=1117311 RepID=A0A9W4WTE0_9GLOM|nr:5974_t:CDS:2 [Funneliformis geosporum]
MFYELKKEHIDLHYYLASDDKAKVNVGIPVIRHIFQIIQSIAKLLEIEDYDFSIINGESDENPQYLKNIYQYCHLFKKLDLNYITICTHALYQSVFNPVERAMATLSKKLAEISFPIDKFDKYLDFQEKVVDQELGLQNF